MISAYATHIVFLGCCAPTVLVLIRLSGEASGLLQSAPCPQIPKLQALGSSLYTDRSEFGLLLVYWILGSQATGRHRLMPPASSHSLLEVLIQGLIGHLQLMFLSHPL